MRAREFRKPPPLTRLALAGLFLIPVAAGAQETVRAAVSGQLLVAGLPADSGTAVLHRITPEDDQGELASVVVDPDGFFLLQLPNLPVPGTDTFLVTTRYDGILYYGPPIRTPAQLDSLYVVQAFPAEAAPESGIRFPIALLEITVEEGPRGWLVTEAFIVRNDSGVTYVPSGAGGTVWQYPLPAGALAPRVVERGPAEGPVGFEDGRIVARNPILPGPMNYFMVEYDVESLEIDFEMPGEVQAAQIFVREPAPSILVNGMTPIEPVEDGGTSYLRWVAQGIRDQMVQVRIGEDTGPGTGVWFSITLALLLVAGGIWGVAQQGRPARGGPGPELATAGGTVPRTRRNILLEVARLDEDFHRTGGPGGAARNRYLTRRAELLRELSGP